MTHQLSKKLFYPVDFKLANKKPIPWIGKGCPSPCMVLSFVFPYSYWSHKIQPPTYSANSFWLLILCSVYSSKWHWQIEVFPFSHGLVINLFTLMLETYNIFFHSYCKNSLTQLNFFSGCDPTQFEFNFFFSLLI